MRKFVLIIVLFFVMLTISGFGQNTQLRFKAGFGTYSMSELKSLQRATLNNLTANFDVPVTVVDNFPGQFQPQVQLVWPIGSDYHTGLIVDYASTGGRLHYSDYSGNIKVDHILSRYAVGWTIEKVERRWQHATFSGFLGVLGMRSKMRIEGTVQLFDEVDEEKVNAVAYGIGILPGAALESQLGSLVIRIEIGGEYNFSADLHLVDDKNAKFRVGQDGIGAQWIGFRGGLTLGLPVK